MRTFLVAFVIWTALLLCWFLFVFQLSIEELVVGAVAALVTSGMVARSVRALPVGARFHLQWLTSARHLPGATLNGFQVLFRSLVRRLRNEPGLSVWQGICFAPPVDPALEAHQEERAGRQALAELLVTLTPNSYVIDVDPDTHLMLIHTLENTPASPILQELEGREQLA